MKKISIIALLIFITNCCICFAAGFPYTLNYQGMLTNKTGQPVNEPQDITFKLYTTPIGADQPFWTELQAKVPVSNGQISVTLGAVTTLDPSKFNGDTYLGIKVGTQAEMLPRQKMTSVPFAFNSVSATNGIPKGGVIMWSGSVDQIPAGWALCDGTNGTPNLKDRFVVSVGDRFGSGKTRNLTGGEEDHILTTNEMPSHGHGGATGGQSQGHNHEQMVGGVDDKNFSHGYGQAPNADGPGLYNSGTFTNGTDRDHNHGIPSEGGGVAHNNLPPYYALAFIMKL